MARRKATSTLLGSSSSRSTGGLDPMGTTTSWWKTSSKGVLSREYRQAVHYWWARHADSLFHCWMKALPTVVFILCTGTLNCRGVHIVKYFLHPRGGGGVILDDVIWGEKCENWTRKREKIGKNKEENTKKRNNKGKEGGLMKLDRQKEWRNKYLCIMRGKYNFLGGEGEGGYSF